MINNPLNIIFGTTRLDQLAFVFEINTANTATGGSNANQFKIPFSPSTTDAQINWIVDWGDGVVTAVTSKTDPNALHTFPAPGIYRIKVTPKNPIINISFDFSQNAGERLKILKIHQWGNCNLFKNCFLNCVNLDLSVVIDAPRVFLRSPDIFNNIFWGCRFNSINHLSQWVIPNLSINGFIYSNPNFNQAFVLNAPNATSLTGIVWLCSGFNQNIVINAPNVEDLTNAFNGATAFNKDVSTWFNWSKVNNMKDFMRGKNSANYNPIFYDNLLIALNSAGRTGVTLGMGGVKYTTAGAAARANLVAKGWTITDGGQI